MFRILKTVLPLLVLAWSGLAGAQVGLRYSPQDTTLAPDETARISILVDDVRDLRTIEFYVDFDPAVVSMVDGGPGTLYTDGGFFLFDGFSEEDPGSWHGYCVIMGSTDYITGPGELFFFELQGLAAGQSPIATVSIALTDPVTGIIDGVTLPSTGIRVRDPGAAAVELPAAHGSLQVAPNPFNPLTEIRFTLDAAGPARLEVLDLAGRRVATLHDGDLGTGEQVFTWNGRDRNGLLQPAGVYFFRLESRGSVLQSKGVLVK